MAVPTPSAAPPSTAPPNASPPSPRTSRSPWAVFAITSIGTIITTLDLSIVNVAFYDIGKDFSNARAATLSWVVTAYNIGFGALLIIGGRTADRLGRKRIFVMGTAGFVAASVLCGIAPNVQLLIAGRALQGIAAAFLTPSTLGLLLPAFPPEKRTQIVSLWGGMGALGVAAGPTVGALLIEHFGWRAAFYVNVPVCSIALIGGWFILTETPRQVSAHRPDFIGAAMITVSLASLALAISEGNRWGWGSVTTIAIFTLAAALIPAFIQRCRRHREPIVDLALFGYRTFSLASASLLLFNVGFSAAILMNILFLRNIWHYSVLAAGLTTCWASIMVALTAGQAGRLANRIGFRPVLLLGATLYSVGTILLMIRVGTTPDRWKFVPSMFIMGVGIGCTFPVLGAASVSELPPLSYATGSAINTTARQVGGVIGVATLVAVIGDGAPVLSDFHHGWVLVLLAIVTSTLFSSRIKVKPAARTASS